MLASAGRMYRALRGVKGTAGPLTLGPLTLGPLTLGPLTLPSPHGGEGEE